MHNTGTRIVTQLWRRADSFSGRFLLLCFIAGVAIAAVNHTWILAFGVGGSCFLTYHAVKSLLAQPKLDQYVLGAVLGIFMAQYIYQMHGMFEMHMFAFIASAFLIIYQDWKLQVPLALVVLVHHAIFGYMHYAGIDSVYPPRSGHLPLQTYITHSFAAVVIFLICAVWAHVLQRSTYRHIQQSFEMGKLYGTSNQTETIVRLNADLLSSNELNKDMADSIRYTQRLQRALLPKVESLQDHFAGSFVFDRPHGIVGGDFLWFNHIGRELLVACVDCTGHGVPGAFMTIVATDLLNRIAREQPDQPPAIMLEMLDLELTHGLGMCKKNGVVDGMDIALCRIDLERRSLRFAGAMRPIVLVSQNGVRMFKGDRRTLGGSFDPTRREFQTTELSFHEGDMLYMFSDGYAHQFGGPQDKKFRTSGVLSLIERIHSLPVEEQRHRVSRTFDDWKGARHQTDDSLFAGIQLKSAHVACASVQAA